MISLNVANKLWGVNMKKILDCTVLVLVFVLLYCVYTASVSGGEQRYMKTSNGKYMVFENGRLKAYVDVEPNGRVTATEAYSSRQRQYQKQREKKYAEMKKNQQRRAQVPNTPYVSPGDGVGHIYWWKLWYPHINWR
jgi:hypothetical protein